MTDAAGSTIRRRDIAGFSLTEAVYAEGGELEVRGRVTKNGRRVAFAEADARDVAGALVGSATTSREAIAAK